jgi:acyl carrier protein
VTETEASALITKLICRARRIEPAQVSQTADLPDELGFDSLDAAELLAALHKETGLQLNIDSMDGMRTVTDIARSLARLPAD